MKFDTRGIQRLLITLGVLNFLGSLWTGGDVGLVVSHVYLVGVLVIGALRAPKE